MKYILIFCIFLTCLFCVLFIYSLDKHEINTKQVIRSESFINKDKHTYIIFYYINGVKSNSIVHDPECKYCYEKFN